jgi:hypothetical protein
MQEFLIDVGQQYVEKLRHISGSDVNGPRVQVWTRKLVVAGI